MEKENCLSKKEELNGSYGSLNRGQEPLIKDKSKYLGWPDLPKSGGGDIDLADYPLQ